MIKLFKKNAPDQKVLKQSSQPGVITAMAGRVQKKVADMLKAKTENWSPKKWKIALTVFCLVFGGSSMYLVAHSLTGKQTNHSLTVTRISFPKYAWTPVKAGDFVMTEKEYRQLRQFDQYIDSLLKSAEGIKIRDSIVSARPGLLDSVRFLEDLYLHQKMQKP